MMDEPIDLQPLDADRIPGSDRRFVDAVMSRVGAMPLPASQVDPLAGVGSSALAIGIAASLAIFAIAATAIREPVPSFPSAPRTIAESIGVPPDFLALPVGGVR
jgi:hypothetical protein